MPPNTNDDNNAAINKITNMPKIKIPKISGLVIKKQIIPNTPIAKPVAIIIFLIVVFFLIIGTIPTDNRTTLKIRLILSYLLS